MCRSRELSDGCAASAACLIGSCAAGVAVFLRLARNPRSLSICSGASSVTAASGLVSQVATFFLCAASEDLGARIGRLAAGPLPVRRAARLTLEAVVPFKANQARRHHIPKQRYQVTNWPEYDAALRQRGSLTVWFTEAAIAAWRAERRTTPGGQPQYSALAITTALTLRAVFRLALRQTEGLIGSIIRLLGLDLAVPDHSTLSRRAETLQVVRPAIE